MLAIIFHNEHAFTNPSMERVCGPYDRLQADGVLKVLADKLNKELGEFTDGGVFEIDGDYLGIDLDKYPDANSDFSYSVWAEIIEVIQTPWEAS